MHRSWFEILVVVLALLVVTQSAGATSGQIHSAHPPGEPSIEDAERDGELTKSATALPSASQPAPGRISKPGARVSAFLGAAPGRALDLPFFVLRP